MGRRNSKADILLAQGKKRCSTCGEVKSVSEFSKNRARLDGWQSECKACQTAHKQTPEYLEKQRGYAHEYRQKPEFKEYLREYRQTPKGKAIVSSARHKRRTAIKSAPSVSASDLLRVREIQEDKCIYCLADLHGKGHLDHIAPLSKNGTNDYDNVAYACEDCNLRKSDKLADEYAAQIGLPMGTLIYRLGYIQANLRPPTETDDE